MFRCVSTGLDQTFHSFHKFCSEVSLNLILGAMNNIFHIDLILVYRIIHGLVNINGIMLHMPEYKRSFHDGKV